MKRKEYGKKLLKRYCELHKYACKEIEESKLPKVRTPDLEIIANDIKIIAEAKDLNANDDDKRYWRERRQKKNVVRRYELAKRTGYLIEKKAIGQLRPHAKAGVPTILVLCDNICVDGIYPSSEEIDWYGPLGWNEIDMALYGLWQANVRFHPDGTRQTLGDTRSKCQIHDREIISAICVIYEHPENENIFIFTYHNYWASVPLPKNVFVDKEDRHFVKTSNPDLQPNNWVQVDMKTS